MVAVPFNYPEGRTVGQRKKIKARELDENPDKLYYDTNCEGRKTNLIFKSKSIDEWMSVIRERYPKFEESKQTWTKLKGEEGTFCGYESGKVVVYGELMDDFEKDFPDMKRNKENADTVAAATTDQMVAVPFNYPEGCTRGGRRKFREQELNENRDKLYYDTDRELTKTNLIFKSKSEDNRMSAIRERYPEFEESDQTWTKFKGEEGTFCVYESGKVVVYGRLMHHFEKHFNKLKMDVSTKKLSEVNNKKREE